MRDSGCETNPGEDLVRNADVAMYLAKTAQTHCEIYAVEKDNYSPSRLALVGELRNAIERAALICGHGPIEAVHLPSSVRRESHEIGVQPTSVAAGRATPRT